jgi:uncharacterized membrane protein YhaH (DUF805 family)
MELRWVLFSWDGRIGRLQYLLGLILSILCVFVGAGLASIARGAGWAGIALIVPFVAFFWIKFAIAVKRLHDLGKSGGWCLLLFVPIVGFVVALTFLLAPGEEHDNQYGPGYHAALPAVASDDRVL